MMMPMGWIWLLLLVAGGLLAWRAFTNRQQHEQHTSLPESQPTESAHDILLKELAKGNITEDEYLAKKKYMD